MDCEQAGPGSGSAAAKPPRQHAGDDSHCAVFSSTPRSEAGTWAAAAGSAVPLEPAALAETAAATCCPRRRHRRSQRSLPRRRRSAHRRAGRGQIPRAARRGHRDRMRRKTCVRTRRRGSIEGLCAGRHVDGKSHVDEGCHMDGGRAGAGERQRTHLAAAGCRAVGIRGRTRVAPRRQAAPRRLSRAAARRRRAAAQFRRRRRRSRQEQASRSDRTDRSRRSGARRGWRSRQPRGCATSARQSPPAW